MVSRSNEEQETVKLVQEPSEVLWIELGVVAVIFKLVSEHANFLLLLQLSYFYRLAFLMQAKKTARFWSTL